MIDNRGILYIVATPIGNLADFSPRAIEILKSVDLIAAEDTRNSSHLLQHFAIGTRLISYHKFNEQQRAVSLLQHLLNGENLALISDAGTPCISDPGSLLVQEAIRAQIQVIGIPGACAMLTALSICGFNLQEFYFGGFLPRKKTLIEQEFRKRIAAPQCTCAWYESPLRLKATLAVLCQTAPQAEVCLCNDLTKKFERSYHGTVPEVEKEVMTNPDYQKGEYVLVVSFAKVSAAANEADTDAETICQEAKLVQIMRQQNCSLREAMRVFYQINQDKLSKKEIYQAGLRLKQLCLGSETEAETQQDESDCL
ncbi:MAG: 16S rRNA (cytidine(1402)-2'-O)-methyltransferase [Negativicutes bacterium]|nr:16S rRNA (cytidine(1402)-2'-O)-methyltransferase [Negativicutes bacterium]